MDDMVHVFSVIHRDASSRGTRAVVGVWWRAITQTLGGGWRDRFHRRDRRAMLASAGDDEARTVLTIKGFLESATWSPDGTQLTVDAYRAPPGQQAPLGLELLVLQMGASGEVVGEPTVLETPDDDWWWSPHWLPDGRGILVQAGDGDVWQISTEPGVPPVEITEDLPPNHTVWDFRISPDGRSIAYTRSIFRGSSIWRVDLGDVFAGVER